MELIETLRWRYATKRYSNEKVAPETLERILTAINLSASSFGLQPYRLVVVENAEIRQQLGMDSFNLQITEASHLLVFAAFDSFSEPAIDAYIELLSRERNIPVEALSTFRSKGLAGLLQKTDQEFFNWSARQAYIALGTALIAAANEGVDATPMEGFNARRADELLGLTERGLKSVVILSLGFRDKVNDTYAHLNKVRWPYDEFISFVG